MPLQATSGAASQDAFGGNGVAVVPAYIEDVFSTYLYTGNDSNRSINNGIDLSTKGGMTWIKVRDYGFFDHALFDTVRGSGNYLKSNSTSANTNQTTSLTSFNTNGFSLGTDPFGNVNASPYNYASWTFAKAPKFFDVVTFTAGTSTNRRISHSLGSVPGFIVVKVTSATGSWYCYHRSLGRSKYVRLNATSTESAYTNFWGTSDPTTTDFGVDETALFNSGESVVAYLFAHDAGGFGLTGTDNVISCGSFTTTTSPDTITLGYEPQWVLIKSANSATNWYIFDNMRGIPTGGLDSRLMPNLSAAESTDANYLDLTATGFTSNFQSIFGDGINLIYIAIRRGPMKVPTDATKVFAPVTRTGSGTTTTVTSTISPTDLIFSTNRDRVASTINGFWDRLRGASLYLNSNTTGAEVSNPSINGFDVQNGVRMTGNLPTNGNSYPYVDWNFKRAPGFFDEVCYTGTGVARTINHNLAAVPELMIVKDRTPGGNEWIVYASPLGNSAYLQMNRDYAATTSNPIWNNTTPTSSVFSVGTAGDVNGSGNTQVAYLFATCAGVSKVGSYTGTGTTQTINCGFTAGSRFVLIKRTDSTGDWYVWDSARGIVAGNDPYLLLNSTAAEVTGTDYIDTAATGFEISSTAPAAINANGGTYIFLAIA
jgi:hypothetical protein